MWTDLKRSLWPGRTAQDDQLHPLLVIAVAVLSAHLPHTTPSYPANQRFNKRTLNSSVNFYLFSSSVEDPDPKRQDPYVFGPSGSGYGSISTR
jgi:hypothetical protein